MSVRCVECGRVGKNEPASLSIYRIPMAAYEHRLLPPTGRRFKIVERKLVPRFNGGSCLTLVGEATWARLLCKECRPK